MIRYLPVLALSLAIFPTLVLPTVASAQEGHLGTPEQQRACRPDVLRHCRGIQDDNAIAGCLSQNVQHLRPACRKVIEGGR
jgi:hypothetical protein